MRSFIYLSCFSYCMDEQHHTETEIETIVVQECKLKGYSQNTIDNYLHYIKRFASSGKSPREYLLGLIAKNNLMKR